MTGERILFDTDEHADHFYREVTMPRETATSAPAQPPSSGSGGEGASPAPSPSPAADSPPAPRKRRRKAAGGQEAAPEAPGGPAEAAAATDESQILAEAAISDSSLRRPMISFAGWPARCGCWSCARRNSRPKRRPWRRTR